MKSEYQKITYDVMEYINVVIAELTYRQGHMHGDMEIGLVLEGNATVNLLDEKIEVKKGDIYFVSAFLWHETVSETGAKILYLQVSPTFFQNTFPEVRQMEVIKKSFYHPTVAKEMVELAMSYINRGELYQLECAGLLNRILYQLVKECGYTITSGKSMEKREKRAQNIMAYVYQNFSKKLLLSEIADRENLTVCYLSHFFKDCFDMTFQEYLQKIRCEKARQLLATTKMSLLDISIECGFSDTKYLNRAMEKHYGSTPAEIRQGKNAENLYKDTADTHIGRRFTPDESLEELERFSLTNAEK